jgi:hypothetical protein
MFHEFMHILLNLNFYYTYILIIKISTQYYFQVFLIIEVL